MEMAEYNLKAPHVSCLYYLYKNGPLTARELCDICDEDKGAISRSLDYLEGDKYISCYRGEKKKYRAPLALTEKGLQVGAEVARKIDKVLGQVASELSEADREAFYRSLELISEDLQKVTEKYDEKRKTNDE